VSGCVTSPVLPRTTLTPTPTEGLVSDELMLEIVKTELDRLRGKASGFSPITKQR
jgi:hypothetical protein